MRRILTTLLFSLMAAALPMPLAAGDWPQFRGPTGQGTSDAKNVPVEWGARKNVAWQVAVPGRGWSSPVLAGGRIYLTTSTTLPGGRVSLRAICFDAESGRILWNVEALRPDAAAVRAMHPKNSPASSTPIITRDRLYVHFGHLGTAALDLSGNVMWRQTGLTYPPVHGNGGSPILVGNAMIFNCDGGRNPFIAALDATTGQIKWTTPRNTRARSPFSFSTPLLIQVQDNEQVISPASGFVGAYDPADGRLLWWVNYGEGYSVVPRPVFADGLLFLSSGFDAPVVYAIRPDGASGDATSTHVAWTRRKAAPNTPSMLVLGDELYTISDSGIATCADAKTGRVIWTHRLDGGFSASPVAAEGRVYFQNEEGTGFVIQAGRTFRPLAENHLGERSLASYAVTDGALFIRTEQHLWKIGTPDGQSRPATALDR